MVSWFPYIRNSELKKCFRVLHNISEAFIIHLEEISQH